MRITRFGAATLAASLAFGGAALAFADEVMPEDPTIVDEVGTTTTTAVVETTTTSAAPKDDGSDAEEDAAEKDGDKAHPDNHGARVSEAAHDTPPGPGHGKAVSEVARSTNHGHTKDATPDE